MLKTFNGADGLEESVVRALPYLDMRGVSKSYRLQSEEVVAVRSLNLTAQRGEFIALMGPSGSGKTTLLNMVAGLERPSTGEIRVGGANVAAMSEGEVTRWRRGTVGYVFQFYNLFPILTAYENVELPLLTTRLSGPVREQLVRTALDLVGMSDRLDHRPAQLSGGQQQRVALARAVVADPEILACDEPTGDLDRVTADQVLSMLRLLAKSSGKLVLIATHDPEVRGYVDRVIRIRKGVIE
ncbi:MAG TPA: ABC transporter ATP-binding protein [Allosphingosinicella sp.]